MKQAKLFFLFTAICFFGFNPNLRAQAVGDYGSATSGNWGDYSTTWLVCVTDGTWDGATAATALPATTTNVWIRNGHTVTIAVTGATCNNLTVMNGGTGVTTSGFLATTTGSVFTLQANSTWKQAGGSSGLPGTTKNFDNTSTVEFNGTQSSLSTFTYGNLTWSSSSTCGIGKGNNLTVNGNLILNKNMRGNSSTDGTNTHTVGGSVTVNGTSTTISGVNNTAATTGNSSWTIAGDVTLNGTSRLAVFESAGPHSGTSTFNIGGNLIINSGCQVTLRTSSTVNTSSGIGAINVKGNIVNNGSIQTTAGATNSCSLLINMEGTNAQQWTGVFPVAFPTGQLCTIQINNPAGVTLNNAVTVNSLVTLKVDAGAILKNAYTLTNSNVTNINGSFQLDEGGWATGNDFVYGTEGTLVFNNSTGFYGVSGTPVFWPTTNGPVNVTVKNSGGLQLEVPRTVSGVFQTSTGVKNTYGNNLTVPGTVKLNTGGYFDNFSPTYTNTSTLEYNTGGTYGTYNEWIEGSVVGYGVPQNVTLSNATTVNLTGDRTVAGTLNLSSGDLSTIGKTLILAGATTGTGTIITGSTGVVNYAGTTAQTISNLKDNAANMLNIINPAGVTLSAPTAVSSLVLLFGNLSLGAYDLTLNNPAGLLLNPEPATLGHIVTDGIGKFIRMVIPGPINIFPVGASATSYDPVKLAPAEPAIFAVNVGTTLPADAPAQYTYAPKVWDISVVGPPPSTVVTLTPSNPVSTVTSDVIGHYEGGVYTNVSVTRAGNDYTAVFTSFSPFVTGTYDVGTSVNQTTAIGIQFDGQTIYNPTKSGLKVYDATGKLTVNSTDDINMSSFPKGIYIIKSYQGTQKIILMK